MSARLDNMSLISAIEYVPGEMIIALLSITVPEFQAPSLSQCDVPARFRIYEVKTASTGYSGAQAGISKAIPYRYLWKIAWQLFRSLTGWALSLVSLCVKSAYLTIYYQVASTSHCRRAGILSLLPSVCIE